MTTTWESAYRVTGNQLALAAFLLVVFFGTVGMIAGVVRGVVRPGASAVGVDGALLGTLVGACAGLVVFVGGWRKGFRERHRYVCGVFDPPERAETVSVQASARVDAEGSLVSASGTWVERAVEPVPVGVGDLPRAELDALRVLVQLERAGVLLVPWTRTREWRRDGGASARGSGGYRESGGDDPISMRDETVCRPALRSERLEGLSRALERCTDLPIPREEDGVEDGLILREIVELLVEDDELRSTLLRGAPSAEDEAVAAELGRLQALREGVMTWAPPAA